MDKLHYLLTKSRKKNSCSNILYSLAEPSIAFAYMLQATRIPTTCDRLRWIWGGGGETIADTIINDVSLISKSL